MRRSALGSTPGSRSGALAALVVALAGCGGDDAPVIPSDDDGTSTSTDTGAPTATVTVGTTTTATQGTSTGPASTGDTIDPETTAGETTMALDGSTTDASTTEGTSESSGSTGEATTAGTGEQGYGDCHNNPALDVCLRGETCIDDGGMPPGVGVCALQGCGTPDECPSAPPGGSASLACMDVTGDLVDECVLQCSGGASCPTGMACFADFVCVWSGGLGPGDFSCADEDVGSAMGAAVAMGSTVGQGNDFAPGCVGPNGQDVQLVWTALVAGTYTFDTVGSSYDTILSVREDCVGPELVCNDDTMMLLSEVTVELAAGQSVLVVIDGYNTSAGNYVLNVN